MKATVRIWLARAGLAALLGAVGWQAWNWFADEAPELPAPRRELARDTCLRAAMDLQAVRGDYHTAVLIPLANDFSGHLTDELRRQLESRGAWHLGDDSVWTRLHELLKTRGANSGNLDALLEAARDLGRDALIRGEVHAFEAAGEAGARLDFSLSLHDAASGRQIFAHRYTNEVGTGIGNTGLETVGQQMEERPSYLRFLIWLGFTALLPVLTIDFLKRATARNSNLVNGVVLLVYTGLGTAVLWMAMGGWPSGWFSTLLFIGAVLLTLFYNIYMTALADRLRR